MKNPGFIHLRTHSAFSLLESTIKLPQLIDLCVQQKMPAVAVTDTANMFGVLEFATLASEAGIQPVIGSLVRICHANREETKEFGLMPLLVQNEVGYQNLMYLISQCYMKAERFEGVAALELETVAKHTEGLLALTGGTTGMLNAWLEKQQRAAAEKLLLCLKDMFPERLYVELHRHGRDVEAETRVESSLIELADRFDIPLVATNDVQFTTPELHEAHDVLLCISQGVTVEEDKRHRVTPHHWFKPADQMLELFHDLPDATANTVVIAQRCSFIPTSREPILPKFPTPDGVSEEEALREWAVQGCAEVLEKRVLPALSKEEQDGTRQKYHERLEFELGVIERMGFEGYFLIVADFIRWSRENSIPVGPGRGSGAGSLVALSLKITDLDPIEHHLLFERFLNPDRISMPDFDIDFCPERREEVISYVQEKYGRDRVGQIITFGKLQARAALRDVGRTLNMSYGHVDRVARMIPNNPSAPATLQSAVDSNTDLQKLRQSDTAVKRLIAIALQLEGLYRHASTHAAGLVIGDRPLYELVPIYRDQKSGMLITQFDMRWSETAGLVKFDFLGLKTLTLIDKTLSMVSQQEGREFKAEDMPFDDEKTFKMLGRAEAIGVFQLESSGMRDILRKLKPDCLEDIIATVALYRPGPMDDIPAFIARKSGKERIVFDHEKLIPILKETYGVFVYQEQVMRVSRQIGRFTPGEADVLRKIMGKKIMKEMPGQRKKFIEGAKFLKIDEKISGEIFDKMAKFGSYGFNKAHSACYGVIAYQTAYLKANYPVEFMTANMILESANIDKLAIFKSECDRMKIKLLQPDINKSYVDFRIEADLSSLRGKAIRYALGAIKNVGASALASVVEEREQKGPFSSLTDFGTRISPGAVNRRTIENLACAGAFDFIHPNRHQIVKTATLLLRHVSAAEEARNSTQVSLFGEAGNNDVPDIQIATARPWTVLEKLNHEHAVIGFYLSDHPVRAFSHVFPKLGVSPISAIEKKSCPVFAGVVTAKSERVGKRGGRFAFITVSDQTGTCEVAVFSELFHSQQDLLTVGRLILVRAESRGAGEEKRFIGSSIKSLEQAAARHGHLVTLYITDLAQIAPVKRILEDAEPGCDSVRLVLDLDAGSEAVMDTGQSLTASLEIRQAIKSLGIHLMTDPSVS